MPSPDNHRRQIVAALAAAGAACLAAPAIAQSRNQSQGQAQPTPPRPRLRPMPEAWLRAPSVPLWPGDAPGAAAFKAAVLPKDWPAVFLRNTRAPSLHVFRPAASNGRAVLVIPGGGYEFVSIDNEGVEVADRLCPLGYTVFVLDYRLPAEGWRNGADVPLQDAQRAIRLVRSLASTYRIDPASVSVLGFSAGGHLAASLATGSTEPLAPGGDAVDRLDARPAATALIYPVITMTEPMTHAGSRAHLLGADPSQAEVERRSAERHVSAATPPLFIAHAWDDQAVPIDNSLMMLTAARAAGVPIEAHLFQEGGHAFGVGRPGAPTSEWIPLLHLWLQRTLAPRA